ncbi:MAG: hypothetical protein R2762_02975 [Bryobacteraceae bacterium]
MRAARSRELAFAGSAAVGLLMAAVVVGSHQRALWATGEAWPLDTVVRQQNRIEAVFQREYASPDTVPAYKFRSLRNRKPAIAVLGSTRMAGVRGSLFGEESRFYNAAGLVRSLGDLQAVLDRVPKTETPPVVLLGLDLWWFSYEWPMAPTDWNRDPEGGWLTRGATIARLAAQPWLLWSAPKSTPRAMIGLGALRSGEGFRSDGSIVRIVSPGEQVGSQPFVDTADPPVAERVKKGTYEFAANSVVSRERLERLRLILRQFRDRGTLVIGVAPPLASAAVDLLGADPRHRQFWKEFREETSRVFRQTGFPFLDASDPRTLGLDDRYLFDGFQAGEVFWAPALERLAKDPRVERVLPSLRANLAAVRQQEPERLLQLGPALSSSLR